MAVELIEIGVVSRLAVDKLTAVSDIGCSDPVAPVGFKDDVAAVIDVPCDFAIYISGYPCTCIRVNYIDYTKGDQFQCIISIFLALEVNPVCYS